MTYATLRVAGDQLVPEQVTRTLKIIPTCAYAKGEHYSGGPRSPDLIGCTGVWFVSREGVVAGNRLGDHFVCIEILLTGGRNETGPLAALQQLLRRRSLHAVVTCFWHGVPGARRPSIPRARTETLKLIPAAIETDFDVDERPSRHAA
jgi:Domain of unknown function (DUF4279)